jgi:hypothetical protein
MDDSTRDTEHALRQKGKIKPLSGPVSRKLSGNVIIGEGFVDSLLERSSRDKLQLAQGWVVRKVTVNGGGNRVESYFEGGKAPRGAKYRYLRDV